MATAVFAMGLVMSVFATPSLADDLEAANAGPAPTLQECRTALERTGRVDDDCAPHRRQLLEEQRAAQEKAAAEKAAQEKAAAEKAAAEKAAAEKAAVEKAAAEKAAQEKAAQEKAPAEQVEEPIVAALGPADCGPDEIYNELTDTCDELPPPAEECDPEDYNGEEPGCGTPPPAEECDPEDYNGEQPGCGVPPVDPGDDDQPSTPRPPKGSGGGNGDGGAAGEQIGSVSGTPEGLGSVVNQCAGSAVCSAAAPAPVAQSSTDGLPDTGAPDSQGLALGGLALLLGGTLLLRPRREVGRHRLSA